MKGEKEGARHPDFARISRPHPSLPTVLLTVELGVFPGAWPGGWERKREKEGRTETESFVLF